MAAVMLASGTDIAEWRARSRALLRHGVPPDEVVWQVAGGDTDLFATQTQHPATPPDRRVDAAGEPGPPVPRGYVDLAETVILHNSPERFAVLYGLLWRLTHGEPGLMALCADPLVHRADGMAAAVRRDMHKMKAFIRFRPVTDSAGEIHVAWFEPDHHIVEATAPFFCRRFASMRWSILTPRGCVFWDRTALSVTAGVSRGATAATDSVEDLWRRYYASIFNPARLNLRAMQAQMPRRYWHNLPEAALIPSLSRAAAGRTQAMLAPTPASSSACAQHRTTRAEEHRAMESIEGLRTQAAGCRQCPLYAAASQTVFGEGPAPAGLMLVGEQPGDQEDIAGRPFVGPAGLILDQALRDARLDRRAIYVTNAVKHFKFLHRGKRRLHQKPTILEIKACLSWLERELAVVQPRVVVALGASAARALTGRDMKIGAARGHRLSLDSGTELRVTVHPSYLLRLPDEAVRAREYDAFVADLRQVADLAPLKSA